MLSLKNNLKSLMKKLIFLLVFLTFAIQLYSKDKPKLILGIVVDQMRYDYVYRFWDNFDENGLKKRSGDILINLESGWIEWNYPTGTTHGSCYSYDTHVPLIFWGKNIKHSTSDELFLIQDIAPTISNILGISYPSGCTGIPIRHITE